MKKNETVTVSFHYLVRTQKNDSNDVKVVPFGEEDFSNLCTQIKSQGKIDISDEKARIKLLSKEEIPLDKIEQVDKRTLFGVFHAPYWGHAYNNSAKGKIPADSVSLRPFYFLIYLADSGRIYVAAQYLGQFGGYTGLKKTVCRMLRGTVVARSFRLGSADFANAKPKEVKINLSKRSGSIASKNVFGQGAVVVFKKQTKDDGFEAEVSGRFSSLWGKPKAEVQKQIAKILNENELWDVKDEDIDDCIVIADVNGKHKTLYLFDDGNFASRFPINVSLNTDGHPEPAPTKTAMLELLAEEIISKKEDA